MLYKINYGLVEMGNDNLKLQRKRRSRHVNCEGFEVPASRTNYHMWSLIPRTIREWNKLPDRVTRHGLCLLLDRNCNTNICLHDSSYSNNTALHKHLTYWNIFKPCTYTTAHTHKNIPYRVVKGGYGSRFTGRKMALSRFTKDKQRVSRFTKINVPYSQLMHDTVYRRTLCCKHVMTFKHFWIVFLTLISSCFMT